MAAMRETSLTNSFTRLPDISITLASGQVTSAATDSLVWSIPSGCQGFIVNDISGDTRRGSTPTSGAAATELPFAGLPIASGSSSSAIRLPTCCANGLFGESFK